MKITCVVCGEREPVNKGFPVQIIAPYPGAAFKDVFNVVLVCNQCVQDLADADLLEFFRLKYGLSDFELDGISENLEAFRKWKL